MFKVKLRKYSKFKCSLETKYTEKERAQAHGLKQTIRLYKPFLLKYTVLIDNLDKHTLGLIECSFRGCFHVSLFQNGKRV